MKRLTDRQAELLAAVDAGNISDRRHLRSGWATRRTDVRSGGPGGGLGVNVTAAARRLRELGLAEPGDPITEGDPFRLGDRPWRLTMDGRLALARHAACSRDRTGRS